MKNYIIELVIDYVKNYKLHVGSKTEWGDPIVGFADAVDPLFPKLKDIVCKEHIMPKDVLNSADTVISYFIPFTPKLVYTNVEGLNCSEEWAGAYIDTNKMLSDLGEYLVNKIKELNYDASIVNWKFDTKELLSNWSQRHVAYIAGIGTFGINNMLITEKGCCGRYGSIVTQLKIEADSRPDIEYCLYKNDGSCKACVKHCVIGALKEDYFDRKKCFEMCRTNSKMYKEIGDAEACGKCLTFVPCTFRNPTKKGC